MSILNLKNVYQASINKDINVPYDYNPFKYIYRKSAPYLIQTNAIEFKEPANFGTTNTLIFPKYADYLSKVYLEIQVPALSIPSGSTYIGWTDAFTFAAIEYIELFQGDLLLQRITGELLFILDELSRKKGYHDAEDSLTGVLDSSNNIFQNATEPKVFLINLGLFFSKDLSMAFPIFLLKYNDLKLNIKFKSFQELVSYDGNTQPTDVSMTSCRILAENIFLLDANEKNKLQRLSYNIFIEQYQYFSIDIPNNTDSYKHSIGFTCPMKEIIWTFKETDSIDNNDYFNYTKRSTLNSLYTKARFVIGDTNIIDWNDERLFRLLNMRKYHTNVSDKHINLVSFTKQPEALSPEGFLDMSKYLTAFIQFEFINSLPDVVYNCYGISWNKITLSNGHISKLYNL
jgi:hypothetical protein